MRGLFLVFEGGDGVGKSTQTRMLASWLRGRGHDVVVTFEPGDGPVGEQIRRLLLAPETGHLSPRAEALLFSADRAQHVDTIVRPALARGAIVVSDRYLDSSLAYQGAGRVLDPAELEPIAWWAADHLKPDLTVLLDVDQSRAVHVKGAKDRLEAAGGDFHDRVRGEFLRLAGRDPDRYLVLAGRDPIDSIAEAVRARVASLLSERAGRLEP